MNYKPEKIGRYKIQAEIGKGAMGVVYRGLDEDLDRTVAIKMLPKSFIEEGDQSIRFKQEAKIVARLDHPNIMKVYSIEYAEDTIWIIMEYLHGNLLSDVMKKGSPDMNQAINIIEQIIHALGYAHALGIIHRDIKPVNIMISPNNTVKIMDFGIAHDKQSDLNLTRTGTIMGTPKYMSPEQFKGVGVDHLSDTYSIGVLAYEIICGEPPFKGSNIMEFAYKHINEKPPPIRNKVPKIPKELETFIHSCLEKNKEKRPQDLNKVSFSPFESETLMVRPKVPFSSKNKTFVYLIPSILIIIVIGTYFYFAKKPDTNTTIHPSNVSPITKTSTSPPPRIATPAVEKPIQIKQPAVLPPQSVVSQNYTPPEPEKIPEPIIIPVAPPQDIVQTPSIPVTDNMETPAAAQQQSLPVTNTPQDNPVPTTIIDTPVETPSLPVNQPEQLPEQPAQSTSPDTLPFLTTPSKAQSSTPAETITSETVTERRIEPYSNVPAIQEPTEESPQQKPASGKQVKKTDQAQTTFTQKTPKPQIMQAQLSRADYLLNQLDSLDFLMIKEAAKELSEMQDKPAKLFDKLTKIFNWYINSPAEESTAIDAISWCCKLAGATGNEKYVNVLTKIINSSNINAKIKSYANKSLTQLFQKNADLKDQESVLIIKQLQSNDYKIIRNTIKELVKNNNYKIEVLREIEKLLAGFAGSPQNTSSAIDVISWCCIALGNSGNNEFVPVLEKIYTSENIHRKAKGHALEALRKLNPQKYPKTLKLPFT